VLEVVYATSTTATGSALGDYAGQVSAIRLWRTVPGASASTAVDVAKYAYDSSGNLREQWDPRISPALKTAYSYTGGRITTVTPPGELPWTLAYGTAATLPTSGAGMLLSVSRPTLASGSNSTVDGTATTTFVYDVPTTKAAGGPYELGGPTVQTWGQSTAPLTAVAVFPADQVPAGNVGRGVLASGSYGRADVDYLDRNGRLVNTATPGGHLTATSFDRFGNTAGTLTAANRDLALGVGDGAAAQLASLGLGSASTAQRAAMLSSTAAYDADGIVKVSSLGPVHVATLVNPMAAAGGLPAQPAGSTVPLRAHTVSAVDAGRPADGTARVSHRVTGTVDGGSVTGYGADADTTAENTSFDWTLGLPTVVVDDPAGAAVTHTKAYNAGGQLVTEKDPGATGTDAATTVISYYQAAGAAPCGGHPEWADLECTSGPAGAITGGGSNPAGGTTTGSTYNDEGDSAVVTESANGSTRVTTTGYDGADRPISTTVTGGDGTAVPAVNTTYSPTTGRVTATGGDGGQVRNEYDLLGRLTAYTDATGARTTYTYDALDRKTSETDAAGSTTTYTYDTAAEPRGLLTSTTDSVAGTFTAGYDADGNKVTGTLPGGVVATTTVDQTGLPVAVQYTTTSGTPIYSDRIGVAAQGQWVSETALSAETYTVDALGRVTQVHSVSADDACTTRTYGYAGVPGSHGDRTSQASTTGVPGGGCPAPPGTVSTHAYDSADRLVDSGYTYDKFGRTTATPSGLSLGYFADDRVRQEVQGDTRQTWDTDPGGRPTSFTVETRDTGGSWTTAESKVNHYRGDDDRPDYIVEDTATGAVTRNVRGTDDQLVATTSATGDLRLQLTDLHGDVSVVYDPAARTADVQDTDEYGVGTPGLGTGRYGYLGGQQRSTEALGGTILMGARVYDPASGRFLQTDPVAGGNANAYSYCSGDPNSCTDATGQHGCYFYFICGEVNNYSGNLMRAGDIPNSGKGKTRCSTWSGEPWSWGDRKTYGCNIRDVRRHGGHLGGWGYDVDLFTFPGTHYYYWGFYQPQNRFVKFPTGWEIDCHYGNWLFAPRCS
jgi:RHS repeat-associated protein